MKIAYIFSYFGDGGTEGYAVLLAQKAREAGNKVVFIISSGSKVAIDRLKKQDFEIIDLPMESSFNPLLVRKSVADLKKIIQSNHIDLVHANMLREQTIACFAKKAGAKFVLMRAFHRFNQFNWKMKPLMSLYEEYTDAVISISDAMSEYLTENGLNDFRLIKNGVVKIKAPSHDVALGFIGRLAKEKGILSFVEANTEMLKSVKLVIAGDGPDYEAIKKIADDKKLKIEMLGIITDKDKFYKKFSVLVLPSDHEVLPLVILEAYSCGLPVIAFDIKPLLELVKPENGMLIKFPDYKQMGKMSLRLLSNSEKYRKTNIDTYESMYSVDKMWTATYDLYKSLMKKH